MTDITEPVSPEFTRLSRIIHWMYGLQAVGLGLALLSVAFALYPSPDVPGFLKLGAVLAGWPALIALYFYRRDKHASLVSPLLATHFEYLNATFLSCLVWLGVLQVLYFIVVGLVVFNGALVLVGLLATLRSGWGWLMFNHGKPMRKKLAPVT